MSHYEERLERDLSRIHDDLTSIGKQVREALRKAVRALAAGDRRRCNEVVLEDHPINRAVRALDARCYRFVAVHLPSAGHLRFVSAVIRVNVALERLGDYAVTIAREALQLSRPPEGTVLRELELMFEESAQMLDQALRAFASHNADMARATMVIADQVERTFDSVFEDLVSVGNQRSITEIFALLVIFHMLERVSDQAKNICEETVFAATGQTKAPKVYRILFLDEDNAALGPLAEALARKRFPNSGEYASAGKQPAQALDPRVEAFMAEHGLPVGDLKPRPLEPLLLELAGYHVLVSLSGPVERYVHKVPFHTVALEWDVGAWPPEGDPAEALESIYRTLSTELDELMHLLRGEEAD